MATFEFLLSDSGQVRIIEFDVADETHAVSSDVTDHPVETGVNISDHVRPRPKTFTIEGIISNTPIGIFAAADAFVGGLGGAGRGEDAYELLLQYWEQGRPLDLLTSLRDYSNLVITNMSVTRNAQTTNGLHITIGLKQISTSRIQETSEFSRQEPADQSRAQPADLGQKAKRPASPELGDFVTNSLGSAAA